MTTPAQILISTFAVAHTGNFLLDPLQKSSNEGSACNEYLYELAQHKGWNPEQDLDWQIIDFLQSAPLLDQAEPLRGFNEYERMPPHEKTRVCWQRHAMEVSELLHGEQGALLLASQLVVMMPTSEGKLFASSQVNDEARHVRFFARYLQTIGGRVYPPSRCLQSVINQALSSPDWSIKCAVCQLLIESLALARFAELREQTRVPVLREGLKLILNDEARHVKSGVETLRQFHNTLTPAERNKRLSFIMESAFQLSNSNVACQSLAQSHQWSSTALRRHLREYHIRHPELSRRRLRQLRLNLRASGLLPSNSDPADDA